MFYIKYSDLQFLHIISHDFYNYFQKFTSLSSFSQFNFHQFPLNGNVPVPVYGFDRQV